MKKFLMIAAIFFMLAGVAFAGTTVTLGWTPNSESDLKGYKVYQNGEFQENVICLTNEASCCVWSSQLLSEGTHEWYVTAFDTAEPYNESGPSNTVSHKVDVTPPGDPEGLSITININITVNP